MAGKSKATENSGKISESKKRSLANLKPFPKGTSGNPGGRPKGLIGQALYTVLRGKKDAELLAIARGIVDSAKKGNPKAFAVIRDSIDGRPPQSVEVTGKDGKPLEVTVTQRLAAARNREQSSVNKH